MIAQTSALGISGINITITHLFLHLDRFNEQKAGFLHNCSTNNSASLVISGVQYCSINQNDAPTISGHSGQNSGPSMASCVSKEKYGHHQKCITTSRCRLESCIWAYPATSEHP